MAASILFSDTTRCATSQNGWCWIRGAAVWTEWWRQSPSCAGRL